MTQTSDKNFLSPELETPSPGAYLACVREQKGISGDYIQRHLGLTGRLFVALECDDAACLPGPVYVRGYLRRYAELVGVRVAPVLAAYQTFLEQNGLVELPPKEEPSERPVAAMIGSALAFLLATSLVFGAMLSDSDDNMPAVSQIRESVEQQPLLEIAPEFAAGENHLKISFTTDSWVEVVDGQDHILAVALQREGSQLSLEGQPPFTVSLGYGPGVSVSYLGESVAFDVDPQTYAASIVVGK